MRLRRKKSIGGRGWGSLPLLRHPFCAAHKFPYGASPLYPIKKYTFNAFSIRGKSTHRYKNQHTKEELLISLSYPKYDQTAQTPC